MAGETNDYVQTVIWGNTVERLLRCQIATYLPSHFGHLCSPERACLMTCPQFGQLILSSSSWSIHTVGSGGGGTSPRCCHLRNVFTCIMGSSLGCLYLFNNKNNELSTYGSCFVKYPLFINIVLTSSTKEL